MSAWGNTETSFLPIFIHHFGSRHFVSHEEAFLNVHGFPRQLKSPWKKRPLEDITGIVVHHTDRISIKKIYELHTSPGHFDAKGTEFFSYHFLILKNGTVWWLNPLTDRVWHAREANAASLGIALHGNFERIPPSPHQAQALRLLKDVLEKEILRRPLTVKGHADVMPKDRPTVCPGRQGMVLVQSLRSLDK